MNARNLRTTIGPDLREIPENPEDMRAEAEELVAKARNASGDVGAGVGAEAIERGRDLSMAGSYFKSLRELERAESVLDEACALLSGAGGRSFWVARFRRFDVYRFQSRFEEAVAGFRGLVAEARSSSELSGYEDFAWQHLGKTLFDARDLVGSREAFVLAMQLRLKKGDKDLIESTQKGLRALEEREK